MRVRWLIAALLLTLPVLFGASDGAAQPNQPPDVVVVLLDDMRESDWQALPLTQERLSGSTWFPNFVLTTPSCCPSRSSLFTGQYAHNHGVLRNEGKNGGWDEYRARGHEQDSVVTWLNGADYRTALVGKYLNGYRASDRVPPGWDRWYAFDTVKESYLDYAMNENG